MAVIPRGYGVLCRRVNAGEVLGSLFLFVTLFLFLFDLDLVSANWSFCEADVWKRVGLMLLFSSFFFLVHVPLFCLLNLSLSFLFWPQMGLWLILDWSITYLIPLDTHDSTYATVFPMSSIYWIVVSLSPTIVIDVNA